jgi:hypothetical protein
MRSISQDLGVLLGEQEGILGFETRFGEPVRTTIYYCPSKITPAGIRDQLNRKYLLRAGEKVELNFQTADQGDIHEAIGFGEYQNLMFHGYDDNFNQYEEYEPANLSVFRFPMPEAAQPGLQKKLDLLASHLSNDEGIVRFTTYFDGKAMGSVYYDTAKTSETAVRNALTQSVLTYFVSEDKTEQIPNPFHISFSSGESR